MRKALILVSWRLAWENSSKLYTFDVSAFKSAQTLELGSKCKDTGYLYFKAFHSLGWGVQCLKCNIPIPLWSNGFWKRTEASSTL